MERPSLQLTQGTAIAEVAWRSGILTRAEAQALADDLQQRPSARARLLELIETRPELDDLPQRLPLEDDRRGPFRLLARLSNAGSSIVWLAERFGEPAIVKELRPEIATGLTFERRFAREAEVVSRLQDPHVVATLGHGTGPGGHPWLALAYIRGGDLAQLLRRCGVVSSAEAVLIGRHIAQALQAAHRAGLVHRAVKPGNILIGDDGCLRLADFGLAVAVTEQGALTMQGTVIGTPGYLAPERVRGHVSDIRADIYALGCVLYECLIGAPPFTGQRDVVLRAHLLSPVPDPRFVDPLLSEGLAKVLLKCLAKDPEDRYQTPDQLAASLAREAETVGAIKALADHRVADAIPAVPRVRSNEEATLRSAPVGSCLPGRALQHPRLTLVSEGIGGGHSCLLFADEAVVFGASTVEADALLDLYPADAHVRDRQRMSRRHLQIGLDATGARMVDLDSANGTMVNGARLGAAPCQGNDKLEIAGVLGLEVSVIANRGAGVPDDRPGGPEAVIVQRVGNRPTLSWALVRRRIRIGGPGADLVLSGLRACDQIEIGRSRHAWWWRPDSNSAWRPVAPGKIIPFGALRLHARAGSIGDGVM